MADPIQPAISAEAALAGAVLAASGAAFSTIPLAMLRHAFPARKTRVVHWGFGQLGIVALLYLTLGSLGGAWLGPDAGFLSQLFLAALVPALIGVTILYWASRRDPRGVASLGLRSGGNVRASLFGVAAYVMIGPAIIGASWAWPWLLERIGGQFEPQQFALGFAEQAGAGLAFAALLAVVVVPFLEELVFRGFLQPLLIQRMSTAQGIAVTSMIFALMHGPSSFLPIFALSLVLGIVKFRTGSLTAAWAVHGVHNGIMVAMLILSGALGDSIPNGA